MASRIREQAKPTAFNPRPPGAPIEGSATNAVLAFMRKNQRIWFTHKALVHHTGRSRVAVDWALIRLRSWDFVETCEDPRSPRYFRYRLKVAQQKR